MLIAGLILFILLHFIPVFLHRQRTNIIERTSLIAYRAVFSLLTLTSLGLIVFGWQAAQPELIFETPLWVYPITTLLVFLGFLLFIASRAPTNIRRLIRHPQLMGVSLWATGHFLANGDSRAMLLFGAFALWPILSMIGTNSRDKEWIKPEKQPLMKDLVTFVIAAVVFTLVLNLHEWFTGIPLTG